MPKDLLARARVEAERARAPIRAAALMRIARVQTTFDRGQARITFEMGLAEARGFRGREGRALLSRIQGEPMLSPDGARVRCPKCEWKPNVESRWGCKCRHCLEHFFDRRIVSRVRGISGRSLRVTAAGNALRMLTGMCGMKDLATLICRIQVFNNL
jgi:hypothetical protein